MITIVILLTLGIYIVLIGSYIYGFEKVPEFSIPDLTPKTSFSIVVAFRDETANLPHLIASLNQLNYPKSHYEVLFVDDDSTDDSVEIIKTQTGKTNLNFQLLNREVKINSPKKDAIQTAIRIAKHEWVITTDADCIVPKYWLDSFDAYIQTHNTKLIAGPVTYHYKNSALHKFQTLDFVSLIGATIGSFGLKKPYMANGANLAYQISFFKELDGFNGNSHIASGDDVFLLQKAVKTNLSQVGFIKTDKALVMTKPVNTLMILFSQRIRWSAKSTGFSSIFGKLTGLLVLTMNVFVISTLLLAALDIISWNSCLYIWIIKISIDFMLLFKTLRFLNQEDLFKSYFWSCLAHPFFISYIAMCSLFSGYNWKGRHFKK